MTLTIGSKDIFSKMSQWCKHVGLVRNPTSGPWYIVQKRKFYPPFQNMTLKMGSRSFKPPKHPNTSSCPHNVSNLIWCKSDQWFLRFQAHNGVWHPESKQLRYHCNPGNEVKVTKIWSTLLTHTNLVWIWKWFLRHAHKCYLFTIQAKVPSCPWKWGSRSPKPYFLNLA